MAASSPKQKKPARQPTKLEHSGFTFDGYNAAIAEAAQERGLSGRAAELLAQEAWAEMED